MQINKMGIVSKLTEMTEAWIISFNPNERQKELASKRLEVCSDCTALKNIIANSYVCGECGCPISKKVFTNEFNPCPIDKWGDVDKYFFIEKNKKTLL